MGLFDFLKPKWKSKDPEVRLAAVGAMGSRELGTLKVVAETDGDLRVQLSAVERIGDRRTLEALADGSPPPEVLRVLRAKIESSLCEEALVGPAPDGIEEALARIDDLALVERLASQAPTPALRVRAVERLTDQETLCRIVETNCGREPARVALARIDREPLLARISRSGASKVTRRLAEEKLAALSGERVDPSEERRARELATLADRAETLASSDDWANAAIRFAGLVQAWLGLDPDREHPLWAAFDGARRRFEVRRGEAVRRAEEARLQADVAAVQATESALSSDATVEGQGPLPPELPDEPSPSDEPSDERELERSRRVARGEEEVRARQEALNRRAGLCAELEALAEAEDRAAAGRRVKELRRAWRELPPSREREARALEERFRAAGDRFSVRQAAFLEQQDWLRWNNKTLKEELCAAMEALEAEEDLAKLADAVKDGQRRWKEIGPAPKAEAEALWQRFQAAGDRAFERCRPYFDELESRCAESLERREELCRLAESHSESTEWKESAHILKDLQSQWKTAGPVPRKQDQELYARFRQACDRFFERRQAHFSLLDEGRQWIQAEKERLCERAEALSAEPDRGHTREFRELQAAWKQLGPAPRGVEQALWERFRSACDRFFEWLDAGRQENLRQKEALCVEVEALLAGAAADADPQEIGERVVELQKRWNEIGPVPKEQMDAIWDRFHKPCDELLTSLRARESRETPPQPG